MCAIANPQASVGSKAAQDTQHYRVGTLIYSRKGLFGVFFWMLWGDFCFTMMEQIIPNVLPLTLKDLGVSNAVMGLMLGTLPGAMHMIVTPAVSYKSDRYRSRLGRRIPFLLFPTPLIALFLILTGCSSQIAGWLHQHLSIGGSPVAMLIGVIAVTSVAFRFFDLFIASVYWYLVNDVIPHPLMGRFYGFARVVGGIVGFLFNRYMLGWADTHRTAIYVIAALLYAAAFLLMCWRVKEGEYPAPPSDDKRLGLLGNVQNYFRECFSNRYYLSFYLAASAFSMASICFTMFRIFFAKELGMTVDAYGKVISWTLLLSVVLSLPTGYLADKIHPLRLQLITMIILPIISLTSFFAIRSQSSFAVWTLIWSIAYYGYFAANGPLFPLLLPQEKFGQFASAESLVRAIAAMASSYIGGRFLDAMGSYRYIYVWNAAFATIALVFAMLLYRGWRRLGGPDYYVAPLPTVKAPADPIAGSAHKSIALVAAQ